MLAGKTAPAIDGGKGQRQAEHESLQSKPISVKILLRIHPDGYCEIYADERVHLYVQKVLNAPGINGERLAIEYADTTLPLSHRGIDDARKLVATFDTRPASVSQFISVQASLSALRIMDAYSARASK